jgi:hypothetical protein
LISYPARHVEGDLYQKQLTFGFWEGSTGVPPVSFGVLFGFDESEQIDQSPYGRDGHTPFLRDEKSNFKETLVLRFFDVLN